MSLANNPRCNSACRACHYKELDYSTQLNRKQDWAESQFGPWKDVLQPIRPAPEEEQLGYRTKSWMRSFSQDGEVSFGAFRSLKIQGRWEKEFVSWDTCPIHTEAIQKVIANIKRAFRDLPASFLQSTWVGVWFGSPYVVFVTRDSNIEPLQKMDWSQILVFPFTEAKWHLNPQVGKRIFSRNPVETLSKSLTKSGPVKVFRQVAQTLLLEARSLAVSSLMKSQPDWVLDLYSGTGDLSLVLPLETGWVGVESDQEAALYAKSVRSPEVSVHESLVGTVEQRLDDPRLFKGLSPRYSLMMNPPRSGLSVEARKKVLHLLHDKPPQTVVYLSCSASALAKDLGMFERTGFHVNYLQPYDFFPQTEHFETLAILESLK